jgi:inosine-uridine nucleoside N-ribohydrolase
VKVIYDTDMALDVDDVGGLAMLHALADRGEVELLGVVVSESAQFYDGLWAPPLVDVIDTYYGRPDVPIGVYRGPHQDIGRQGHYAEKVVKAGFPHDLASGADAPDGYKVYRKLLAAQPDASVVVITVGYLTNLAELLRSSPDELSPLSGVELVRRKVAEWSCMGGGYPTSGEDGEFNLGHYPDASNEVIATWPGRAVFGGFELGQRYKTGAPLQKKHDPRHNPVAMSFLEYNGGQPRESWDEVSVLYGVRGLGPTDRPLFGAVARGRNTYEKLGKFWGKSNHEKSQNVWQDGPAGDHAYLTEAMPIAEVEALIDELIVAPPRARQRVGGAAGVGPSASEGGSASR